MIIGIFLIVFSCRKSAPHPFLPPITNSGEQTLGFLANNEEWVPYDRGNHKAYELPPATIDNNHILKISATRIDETNSARNWFCIEAKLDILEPGKYEIANRSCNSPYQTYYYGSNKDKKEDVFILDTLKPHFVDVQFIDTDKKIISGTFEFSAFTEYGDSINVRSGRFDLNFNNH